MAIFQFSNIFRKELRLYNTKLNFIKIQCPISERKGSRLTSFLGWYNCIHHTIITGPTIIYPLIFAEDKNTWLHKLQRIEIWRRKINDKNNERWRISWTWINGRGLHWLWVTPPYTGVHWRTATKKDNSCWQRIAEEAQVTARNDTNGHSVFQFCLGFFWFFVWHAFCYKELMRLFSYTWPVNLG